MLITALVLLADQVLKVWVKLTFYYDSAIPILGSKGYLHFIENRGMAFGLEFGGDSGKLLLTLFRIAAVVVIALIMLFLTVQNFWFYLRILPSFSNSLLIPL